MNKLINRLAAQAMRTQLLNDAQSANVLLVEGARQVGKTTLVKEVLRSIPDVQSISLNLETDAVLNAKIGATREFSEFVRLLRDEVGLDPARPQILSIDEAQESEVLGRYVRSLKEELPNTRTILSGSSMTRLFRLEQRIPVGRYSKLIIYPLTFREFLGSRPRPALQEILTGIVEGTLPPQKIDLLSHKALLEEFDLYLQVGGLPHVVTTFHQGGSHAVARQQVLLSQEDDFIRKSGISKRDLFQNGLRAVANALGSPSKLTQLDSNYRVARDVINQLQAWHLIVQVEQHGMSSTTSFLPKRYLYDIGVAQSVRNMPYPALSIVRTVNAALRTQLGGVLENAVLLNLLTQELGVVQLGGWKSGPKNPIEVDFVWRSGTSVVPIECKASFKNANRNYNGLLAFLEQADLSIGYLMSAAPYSEIVLRNKKLVNLPVYLALPELMRA